LTIIVEKNITNYKLGKNKKKYAKYYLINKKGEKYLRNVEIMEYNMDKIMEY